MACCALALMIATIVVWWKRFRRAIDWRTAALRVIPVTATSLALLAFAILHDSHMGAYAPAGGRPPFAEIIARSICGGGSSTERAAAIAGFRIAVKTTE